MMHGREKSDSAIVAGSRRTSDYGRSGAGGAKGGGQGECEPAKHGRAQNRTNRVTGAGATHGEPRSAPTVTPPRRSRVRNSARTDLSGGRQQ